MEVVRWWIMCWPRRRMALCPVDSGDKDGINHKRHSFF